MQIGRCYLACINFINQRNEAHHESVSKLVTQPSFRAVGQTRGMADIFMSVTECSLPHIEIKDMLYIYW